MVEIDYKCLANDKGFCTLKIAAKCIHAIPNKYKQCCRINNFTDYLLIKLLLIIDKEYKKE